MGRATEDPETSTNRSIYRRRFTTECTENTEWGRAVTAATARWTIDAAANRSYRYTPIVLNDSNRRLGVRAKWNWFRMQDAMRKACQERDIPFSRITSERRGNEMEQRKREAGDVTPLPPQKVRRNNSAC